MEQTTIFGVNDHCLITRKDEGNFNNSRPLLASYAFIQLTVERHTE